MKKNLLLFIPEVCYPVDSGGTLALYEKIKILSEQYNIFLFVLNVKKNKEELELFYKEMSKYTKFVKVYNKVNFNLNTFRSLFFNLKTFFSFKPRFIHFLENLDIDLNEFIIENDIKLIMFEILPATVFLKFLNNNIEYIYFSHNAEACLLKNKAKFEKNLLKKLYLYFDYLKVKEYEKNIIYNSKKTFLFTKNDFIHIFRKNDKLSNIEITPPLVYPKSSAENVDRRYFLITTNLDYIFNEISLKWFFKKVFPLIDKNIIINITGKDKNNYLLNLSKKYSNIKYHGFLDKSEYEELYKKVYVVINPTLYGSGIQMKLLEALAFGKQVVTTNFSNFLGNEICSSDEPQKLANFINGLFYGENNCKFDYNNFFVENKERLFEKFEVFHEKN